MSVGMMQSLAALIVAIFVLVLAVHLKRSMSRSAADGQVSSKFSAEELAAAFPGKKAPGDSN